MTEQFRALVVNKTETDFSVSVQTLTLQDLPDGDVTIQVAYSSVNYKDGLASTPNGKIVRSYPFVPGIDLSGTVVASRDDRFAPGDQVIVTSYDLGVSHYGGFSEYARVPADWVVPLPAGLTLEEAMVYGTAGFTAALSVHRLEQHGLTPERGPVLVTGATGGVGSTAVAMLAKRGYHVVASTGKEAEREFLETIGASEVISREEAAPDSFAPLGKQRWAAVVDPVGGKTLAAALSNIQYGGAAAVSGLTGGTKVDTTVFPFILRGVNLLGIDSVYCPMELRRQIWTRMATDLKPEGLLNYIANTVELEELPPVLSAILQGQARGRTIVKL